MPLGPPFSDEELMELRRRHALGESDDTIAWALNRSNTGIRRRREGLRLRINRQIRPPSGKFRKREINHERRFENIHGNGVRPDKQTLADRIAERDHILNLPRSIDTDLMGDPVPGSGRSALERRVP